MGVGGGRIVQLDPSHDSANGPPRPSPLKLPTAKQAVAVGQETASNVLYRDPLGMDVGSTVQLLPVQRSASGMVPWPKSVRPGASPTAVQLVAVAQETLLNAPTKHGPEHPIPCSGAYPVGPVGPSGGRSSRPLVAPTIGKGRAGSPATKRGFGVPVEPDGDLVLPSLASAANADLVATRLMGSDPDASRTETGPASKSLNAEIGVTRGPQRTQPTLPQRRGGVGSLFRRPAAAEHAVSAGGVASEPPVLAASPADASSEGAAGKSPCLSGCVFGIPPEGPTVITADGRQPGPPDTRQPNTT